MKVLEGLSVQTNGQGKTRDEISDRPRRQQSSFDEPPFFFANRAADCVGTGSAATQIGGARGGGHEQRSCGRAATRARARRCRPGCGADRQRRIADRRVGHDRGVPNELVRQSSKSLSRPERSIGCSASTRRPKLTSKRSPRGRVPITSAP
jgi:hypothetical protein